MWERRTAIVTTAHFIMKLRPDRRHIRHCRVARPRPRRPRQQSAHWLTLFCTVGDKDRPALLAFLDKYALTMQRVLLRYSIEKLDEFQRKYYPQYQDQISAAGDCLLICTHAAAVRCRHRQAVSQQISSMQGNLCQCGSNRRRHRRGLPSFLLCGRPDNARIHRSGV